MTEDSTKPTVGNKPHTEPTPEAAQVRALRKALMDNDLATAEKLAAEAPQDSGPARPEDLAEQIGQLEDPKNALEVARKALARRPLEVVTTWDTSKPPPAREWLSPGWIPAGRLTLFTGEGGAGKSRFALQLAAAVASGHRTPFPSLSMNAKREAPTVDPKPGRVLYMGWEDEPTEILRRLYWARVEGAELANRLHYLNLEGQGPIWGPLEGRHEATMADITTLGRKIEAMVRRLADKEDPPLRLVVVDPAAAAYASSENARGLVRAFCGWLGNLARTSNAAVLLVAHPPKNDADFSGSTDWRNAPRAMLTLETADTETGDFKKNAKNEDLKTKKPVDGWRIRRGKASYAPPGSFAWLGTERRRYDKPKRLDVLRWTETDKEGAAAALKAMKNNADWP